MAKSKEELIQIQQEILKLQKEIAELDEDEKSVVLEDTILGELTVEEIKKLSGGDF